MNAVLGTIQYRKAEKSLDSLKDLAAPAARVIRDGKRQEIASKEIVPGDYVILEAGDMIVADGRILRNYSLQVNEGSLTGESANVEKMKKYCRKKYRWQTGKYGIFRKLCNIWKSGGTCNSNRNGDGIRKDCRVDESDEGAEDSASDKS